MSLNLDKRQRAMLREMGVRVWLPAARLTAPPADPLPAMNSVAARADLEKTEGPFDDKNPGVKPLAVQVAPPLRAPPRAAGVLPSDVRSGNDPAAWRLGQAQLLYADTARAQGARWLVLAETPAAALNADPFHGDAGKLLGNMLRAARLHQAGVVLFAPLTRVAAAGTAADLSALIASAQPDLVLVMGRLAAQALLRSTEPFSKLRGQVHRLHGANTIVTYDAPYLLRSPADKVGAWDDLCLAMSLAPGGLARPV